MLKTEDKKIFKLISRPSDPDSKELLSNLITKDDPDINSTFYTENSYVMLYTRGGYHYDKYRLLPVKVRLDKGEDINTLFYHKGGCCMSVNSTPFDDIPGDKNEIFMVIPVFKQYDLEYVKRYINMLRNTIGRISIEYVSDNNRVPIVGSDKILEIDSSVPTSSGVGGWCIPHSLRAIENVLYFPRFYNRVEDVTNLILVKITPVYLRDLLFYVTFLRQVYKSTSANLILPCFSNYTKTLTHEFKNVRYNQMVLYFELHKYFGDILTNTDLLFLSAVLHGRAINNTFNAFYTINQLVPPSINTSKRDIFSGNIGNINNFVGNNWYSETNAKYFSPIVLSKHYKDILNVSVNDFTNYFKRSKKDGFIAFHSQSAQIFPQIQSLVNNILIPYLLEGDLNSLYRTVYLLMFFSGAKQSELKAIANKIEETVAV